MNSFDLNIKPFGKQAILIEWPNRIDDRILDDIIQFTAIILKRENVELNNHTPGYNSLLLQYNSIVDFSEKKQLVIEMYKAEKREHDYTPNHWHIPVCYNEEFAVDLPLFSEQGLALNAVIDLHTSASYRVYMIGFLPGFLYLGGLPKELHLNRKEKPRLQVPKGSVAIGGEQTGIYPMDSPGGWNIIGRTPLTLFDLTKKDPTPIRQGDIIQFYPINLKTYEILMSL